jgi:hypothetical protein
MHDLSEFMKSLLQRFTRWFNRKHDRCGRLWEQRFKSVIVEDGFAAKAMAAYIDLNPVRAGMVKDPADYRWSSYGEAVGGGKKARAGLVRALGMSRSQQGRAARASLDFAERLRAWAQGGVGKHYRVLLLGKGQEVVLEAKVVKKGMSKEEAEKELAALADRKSDLSLSKMIRHRVRYFSDGAVIGSREFVDEVFQGSCEKFGKNRKDGARKPRGALGELAGTVWSARDLRKE